MSAELRPVGSSQLLTPIRVLVPGTGARFRCGGLSVALQTARLLSQLRPTEVVTYRQREANHPFLNDLLKQEAPPGEPLWLVSWGFHVPQLLRRLRGRPVVYQAHSSGYGFDLPPGIPVLAVSRNTLGYWGDRAPRNPLFLLPNALEPQWLERGQRDEQVPRRRPIDVLVQQRKSSDYVIYRLVPALRARGLRVEVQNGWVEDLVDLFNSASVYLYDSAEHWRAAGVSEGFGLPPLEAMACGCVVFSSFNHALADFLSPGSSTHQIGQGCLANDVDRITSAVAAPELWRPGHKDLESLLKDFSEDCLLERWQQTLQNLEELLAWGLLGLDRAAALSATSPLSLRWQRRWRSGRRRVANRLSSWLSNS